MVVLLAEDVDRNRTIRENVSECQLVVLLAEDVDRNPAEYGYAPRPIAVVLLAEDVDRNAVWDDLLLRMGCRPPRGGRG